MIFAALTCDFKCRVNTFQKGTEDACGQGTDEKIYPYARIAVLSAMLSNSRLNICCVMSLTGTYRDLHWGKDLRIWGGCQSHVRSYCRACPRCGVLLIWMSFMDMGTICKENGRLHTKYVEDLSVVDKYFSLLLNEMLVSTH